LLRRRTVAAATADGLHVVPGRAPHVRVRSGPASHSESLESERETYWADCYEQAARDLERLEAEAAELRRALDGAMLLLGRSVNTSENYEAKADAFYHATGMMAPGKDAPAACGPHDYNRRDEAWRNWYETKLADIRDAYAALSPAASESEEP
jgi:hypothetical protein